jgi:hypothetical protein
VVRAAEVAAGLLGMGPGLTPSGDDVVMGLLLALNRCAAGGWDRGDLDQLNRALIDAATQRTTLLSANAITCAAAGEADERLLAPLDAAWGGRAPSPEAVVGLLGWGASSGRDALVGMAVALLASA